MANKINVKLILELRAGHMSRNAIARTRHMSKNSVGDVFHIADSLGIIFDDVKEKPEEEVYRIFYPDKYVAEDIFTIPDYEYVHNELRRVGVTLKLLWEEYCSACRGKNEISMGYTKFCRGYSAFTVKNKITNHLNHKPGIITEVDWSGPTMSYVDKATGEIIKVYLFVASLPYSQYSYVEACLDMKQDTWLNCHIHMYEFFGGVRVRTVCDNLKTGVVSHPKEGDIILNGNYEALGIHYVTAIMPTGVKRPKHKASVEGNVGKIATAIIAKLRNITFFSFAELKTAVREKLYEFNAGDFQKREGSRKQIFEEERNYLRSLPSIPYEIAEWIYGRSINLDCHVVYNYNRYSCPYQYIGKKADLKITDTFVEIYVKGERVATHPRYPDYVKNQYATHKKDMPDQFQKPEWDDVRIKRWAYSIGVNTGTVIDRIFNSVKIKEQGYNPSLSVLRLSKSYSETRLETACELALTRVRTPRYAHLKSILAANQDLIYFE
ncbi:MAG: IS21 family transposase, partial [Oscillospiraceae bacterium]|nr:IS21 family transposase [Oscillospiraceae bacterium]